MSPDLPLQNLDSLVSDLFAPARASRALSSLGVLLAISLHAAGFGLALSQRGEKSPPARAPIEVELPRQPEPPAPHPPPAPEPEAKLTEPQAPARSAPARVAASPPPAAARAGALHTAKDDPSVQPQPDEPLDFTHDPSVVGFGAGVVAVGGTARFGAKDAAPRAEQAKASVEKGPRSTGDAVTAAEDLGRKPVLGVADPCHGYFPPQASDDVASASVMVVIGKTGSVSNATVISENPRGQGFGAAARTCMKSQHFTPALDREGRPTATAIRVNVRFTR
jgi:hypothetical protein